MPLSKLTTAPKSVKELEEMYPVAFKYLMNKKPTSISMNGELISLNDSKIGFQLCYDIFDIIIFNMIFSLY